MPPAILHIIGGNDRGKQFELNKPEMRIGRGTDQDVVLADIAVSRRHVTILMDGQRFRLKDLGSGNGSLVNGQRQDTVILNDGDQVEIGNTLMRFDHAASRPAAAPPPSISMPAQQPVPPGYPPSYPMGAVPPGYPPPGYPPPGYAPMPGYPPSYPNMPPGYPPTPYGAPGPAYPHGYPPPGYPQQSYGGMPGDPSLGGGVPPGAVSMGGAPAPSYVGSAPPRTSARQSGLGSPVGKLLAFGAMLLVSTASLIAIVSRTVFAQPVVVGSEAEETYRQGLRLFAAADYELAKAKFAEASAQAKDAPEPLRYMRLCDSELAARTSFKNAEAALVSRRFVEAVRAVDAVEPTSVYYDQCARIRRDNAPKAASEMLDEVRRIRNDNPDEARNRLKAVLDLDPSNPDARDMLAQMRSGGAPSQLQTTRTPASNPPPSPSTVAAISHEPRQRSVPRSSPSPKAAATGDDDPDLASVKVKGKDGTGSPVAGPPPDSKAGMAAYKSRDFIGAAKLFRAESMKQASEKQAIKTLEFANQVQALNTLVDRAAADETKNPGQAAKDYQEAIALDQRLSRGVHTAYFKQRMSGLGLQAAKQSYSSGKFEDAYQLALTAQRGGADTSAIMKQLEQKASELVQQGIASQKTNVTQAKQYWHTVLKMVPSSSPNYTKAYSLVNSVSRPKRDEDED